MNNETIQLTSDMSLKYLEMVIINNSNIYKYEVSFQQKIYNLYSDTIIDATKMDKTELSGRIINKINDNPNEKDVFIELNDLEENDDSSSAGTSANSAINSSTGTNADSNSDSSSKSNSRNTQFGFILENPQKFIEAYDKISNLDCPLLTALNSFNTADVAELPAKYGTIADGVTDVVTKLNSMSGGKGVVDEINEFKVAYKGIQDGILESIAAEYKFALDNNKILLDADSLKAGFSNEDYRNDFLSIIEKCTDKENRYSTLTELFDDLGNINAKYSVTTIDEAKELLNANNLSIADLEGKELSDEEKLQLENLKEQRENIFKALNESLGMSRSEFDTLVTSNIDKLAKLISDSSFEIAKNSINGTQSDESLLNSFFYEMQNDYYSSEAGQQSLLNRFLEESGTKFDEYNAIGYTDYIKYCVSTGHTYDWLMEELRAVASIVNKIDGNSNFAFQKEVTDKSYLASIKDSIDKTGVLPYGITEKGGKYFQTSYTKLGDEMLYYMDYHWGENVGNSGEDKIITAFSNQGYVDAIERNYKGSWIASHSESDDAERDYYILNGVINDQERYNELIAQGELSFEQLVNYINAVGHDSSKLLSMNYIEQNKDAIMAQTGLTEAQLYNFAIPWDEANSAINGAVLGTKAALATEVAAALQLVSGVAKFGENIVDAAQMAITSDFMLAFSTNEYGGIQFNIQELMDLNDNYKKLAEKCWSDYVKNTALYNEQYEAFFKSESAQKQFEYWFNYKFYDALIGYVIPGVDGTFQSFEDIPISVIEGYKNQVIPDFFKENKFAEWSLNDSSSSNQYLAAFKLGIRDGGDFTYFDNLSEEIVTNAQLQFDTMERVAVDNIGNWMQNTFYDEKWYQEMESYSFVKHDNILGMTANQIGNMAIPVLVSSIPYVGQVLSSSLLFTSAFGGASEEAINSGASYNEALTYATLSATTELLIEKAFSGIAGFGEGWADDLISYVPDKVLEAANLTDNLAAQITKQMITNGIGEGVEEIATDFVTPLWQSLTYMSEKTYSEIVSENVSLESEVQTFLVSFLSSMVFGTGNITGPMKNFNNQMNSLEQTIGEIPGMRDTANKVLAEILSEEDPNYSKTDIINKIIEKNSIELAKNPDAVAAVQELQEQLIKAKNELEQGQVTIKTDSGDVSVSKSLLMNITDALGIDGKYSVTDGELTFNNDKTKIAFIEAMYNSASNQLAQKEIVHTLTSNAYENALNNKNYSLLSSAIETLKQEGDLSYASETLGTVNFEIDGQVVQVPQSVVQEITNKYNIDGENNLVFTDDMTKEEFAKSIYEKAIQKSNESKTSIAEQINKINEALKTKDTTELSNATNIVEETITNESTQVVITNSTKVEGKDLVKLEVQTTVDGEQKTVNVYVDSSTSSSVYKEGNKVTEKIQEVIEQNKDSENVYVGEITYDKKTDVINTKENTDNKAYVELIGKETVVEEVTEKEVVTEGVTADKGVQTTGGVTVVTEASTTTTTSDAETAGIIIGGTAGTMSVATANMAEQITTNENIDKQSKEVTNEESTNTVVNVEVIVQKMTEQMNTFIEKIKNECQRFVETYSKESSNFGHRFEQFKVQKRTQFNEKLSELRNSITTAQQKALSNINNEIEKLNKNDSLREKYEKARDELVEKYTEQLNKFVETSRAKFENILNSITISTKDLISNVSNSINESRLVIDGKVDSVRNTINRVTPNSTVNRFAKEMQKFSKTFDGTNVTEVLREYVTKVSTENNIEVTEDLITKLDSSLTEKQKEQFVSTLEEIGSFVTNLGIEGENLDKFYKAITLEEKPSKVIRREITEEKKAKYKGMKKVARNVALGAVTIATNGYALPAYVVYNNLYIYNETRVRMGTSTNNTMLGKMLDSKLNKFIKTSKENVVNNIETNDGAKVISNEVKTEETIIEDVSEEVSKPVKSTIKIDGTKIKVDVLKQLLDTKNLLESLRTGKYHGLKFERTLVELSRIDGVNLEPKLQNLAEIASTLQDNEVILNRSEMYLEDNVEPLILTSDFVSTLSRGQEITLRKISSEQGLIEYLNTNGLLRPNFLNNSEISNSSNKYVKKLLELTKGKGSMVFEQLYNVEDVVKNDSSPIIVIDGYIGMSNWISFNELNEFIKNGVISDSYDFIDYVTAAKKLINVIEFQGGKVEINEIAQNIINAYENLKLKSNEKIANLSEVISNPNAKPVVLPKTISDIDSEIVYEYLTNERLLRDFANGKITDVNMPQMASALKTVVMMHEHLGIELDIKTIRIINNVFSQNIDSIIRINVESKLPKVYWDYMDALSSSHNNVSDAISKLESIGYSSTDIAGALLSVATRASNYEISRKAYNQAYEFLTDRGYSDMEAANAVGHIYENLTDARGYDTLVTKDGVRIHIQKGINWNNQAYTLEYIQSELSKIKGIYKTDINVDIYLYDTFNAYDKYWEVKYKSKNFKSEATGGNNTINIYKTDSIHDTTLSHEYAHLIDKQIMADLGLTGRFAETNEWLDAVAKDKNAPTGYAKTNSIEDFAESVAAMSKNPTQFKNNFPNRYQVLSKYINVEGNVTAGQTEVNIDAKIASAFDTMIAKFGESEALGRINQYIIKGDSLGITRTNDARNIIKSIDKNTLIQYINRNYGTNNMPVSDVTTPTMSTETSNDGLISEINDYFISADLTDYIVDGKLTEKAIEQLFVDGKIELLRELLSNNELLTQKDSTMIEIFDKSGALEQIVSDSRVSAREISESISQIYSFVNEDGTLNKDIILSDIEILNEFKIRNISNINEIIENLSDAQKHAIEMYEKLSLNVRGRFASIVDLNNAEMYFDSNTGIKSTLIDKCLKSGSSPLLNDLLHSEFNGKSVNLEELFPNDIVKQQYVLYASKSQVLLNYIDSNNLSMYFDETGKITSKLIEVLAEHSSYIHYISTNDMIQELQEILSISDLSNLTEQEKAFANLFSTIPRINEVISYEDVNKYFDETGKITSELISSIIDSNVSVSEQVLSEILETADLSNLTNAEQAFAKVVNLNSYVASYISFKDANKYFDANGKVTSNLIDAILSSDYYGRQHEMLSDVLTSNTVFEKLSIEEHAYVRLLISNQFTSFLSNFMKIEDANMYFDANGNITIKLVDTLIKSHQPGFLKDILNTRNLTNLTVQEQAYAHFYTSNTRISDVIKIEDASKYFDDKGNITVSLLDAIVNNSSNKGELLKNIISSDSFSTLTVEEQAVTRLLSSVFNRYPNSRITNILSFNEATTYFDANGKVKPDLINKIFELDVSLKTEILSNIKSAGVDLSNLIIQEQSMIKLIGLDSNLFGSIDKNNVNLYIDENGRITLKVVEDILNGQNSTAEKLKNMMETMDLSNLTVQEQSFVKLAIEICENNPYTHIFYDLVIEDANVYFDVNGKITSKLIESIATFNPRDCSDLLTTLSNSDIDLSNLTIQEQSYIKCAKLGVVGFTDVRNISEYFDETGMATHKLISDIWSSVSSNNALGMMNLITDLESNNYVSKNTLNEVFNGIKNANKLFEECKNVPSTFINEYVRYMFEVDTDTHEFRFSSFDEARIEDVSKVLNRLSSSNSGDIKRISHELVTEIMRMDNPIEAAKYICEIFEQNHIPYVGKVFKIFQYLTNNNIARFYNGVYSPALSNMAQNGNIREIYKILFSDLVRTSFGSNNRNAIAYLNDIEVGNNLFEQVRDNKVKYDELSNEDKGILDKFAKNLQRLYNQTQEGLKNPYVFKEDVDVIKSIQELSQLFKPTSRYSLPDRIVRSFAYDAGFKSFAELKEFTLSTVSNAHARNIEFANKNATVSIEPGDLIKASNSRYITSYLQNGNVAPEFLGKDSGSNATLYDADYIRIPDNATEKNIDAINRYALKQYGSLVSVVKFDSERIELTDKAYMETKEVSKEQARMQLDEILEDGANTKVERQKDTHKLELFRSPVINNNHYGIRTGNASTDISYFVATGSDVQMVSFEIARNGFYIPVYSAETGNLVFTPSDYEMLRMKMQGLSYYNTKDYVFSSELLANKEHTINTFFENLKKSNSPLFDIPIVEKLIGVDAQIQTQSVSSEVRKIFEQFETGDFNNPDFVTECYELLKEGKFDALIQEKALTDIDKLHMLLTINKLDTTRKRNAILSIFKETFSEFGLETKLTIDGDVSLGAVEIIDTGSTGRNANVPGDGDFDFTIKVDGTVLNNRELLEKIESSIKSKFTSIGKDESVAHGPRLKNVTVPGLDVPVDIDISYVKRTLDVEYSTDMALSDRYDAISKDPTQRDLLVAELVNLKQMLKDAKAYKKHNSPEHEGGLGGVGVENLLLQNGGSIIEVAKSFIEASRRTTFNEYLSNNPDASFKDYIRNEKSTKSWYEFHNSYSVFDLGENHYVTDGYAHDNFVYQNMDESGYEKMVKAFEEYLENVPNTTIEQNSEVSMFETNESEISSTEDTLEHFEDIARPMTTESEIYTTIPKGNLTISQELVNKYGKDVVDDFIELYDKDYLLNSYITNMDMQSIRGVLDIINELGVDIEANKTLSKMKTLLEPLDGRHILNLSNYIYSGATPIRLSQELYDAYGEQINELYTIIVNSYNASSFLKNPDLELLKKFKEGLFSDTRFDSSITREIQCIYLSMDALLDGKVLVNANDFVSSKSSTPVYVEKSLYEFYKDEFKTLEKITEYSSDLKKFIENPNTEDLEKLKKLFADTRINLNSKNMSKLHDVMDSLLEGKVVVNSSQYIYGGDSAILVSKDYYQANKTTIDEYISLTEALYKLKDFLNAPDINLAIEFKKIINSNEVITDNKYAKVLKTVIDDVASGKVVVNINGIIYDNAKPVVISGELYNSFVSVNPNPEVTIQVLYDFITSNNEIYKLLSNETVYGRLDIKKVKESLEYLVSIANQKGYSDLVIREAKFLLDTMEDTYSTEDLYDIFSIAHTEFNTPEGYYEFVDILKSFDKKDAEAFNRLNDEKVSDDIKKQTIYESKIEAAIRKLENNGYTNEQISEIILHSAARANNQKIARDFYYRAFDYLVEKNIDEKEASKIIYKQYATIIERRGTRVVGTTPSGIKISVINNLSTNNKLLTAENIENIIMQAEKLYSKTDLKEITIYDTFSPKNIYSEKIQYEDYVKTHNNKRFISAASASATDIVLWEDFDRLESLVHEYAHTIDRHIKAVHKLSKEFSSTDEWTGAIRLDKDVTMERVSAYASASNAEDFAEFVMHFYKNPFQIALKYPNRYKAATKYLNMDIDATTIRNYLDKSPLLFDAIEKMSVLLTSDGSTLEFVKQYVFSDLKGDNNIARTVIQELDAIYETRREIVLDYDVYSLLNDIKVNEGFNTKDFLEIIKHYIDGKDVSYIFDDPRDVELLKMIDKEGIQEWYEEELNEATLEPEKTNADLTDDAWNSFLNNVFGDSSHNTEMSGSVDTNTIPNAPYMASESVVEDSTIITEQVTNDSITKQFMDEVQTESSAFVRDNYGKSFFNYKYTKYAESVLKGDKFLKLKSKINETYEAQILEIDEQIKHSTESSLTEELVSKKNSIIEEQNQKTRELELDVVKDLVKPVYQTILSSKSNSYLSTLNRKTYVEEAKDTNTYLNYLYNKLSKKMDSNEAAKMMQDIGESLLKPVNHLYTYKNVEVHLEEGLEVTDAIKDVIETTLSKIEKFNTAFTSDGTPLLRKIVIRNTTCPQNYIMQLKSKNSIGFSINDSIDMNEGIIEIWDGQVKEERIIHQLSHMIANEKNSEDISRKWITAMKSDNGYVSIYSKTSISEDFAESLTAFIMNPSEFSRLFVNRKNIIERMLTRELRNSLKVDNKGNNPYVDTGIIVKKFSLGSEQKRLQKILDNNLISENDISHVMHDDYSYNFGVKHLISGEAVVNFAGDNTIGGTHNIEKLREKIEALGYDFNNIIISTQNHPSINGISSLNYKLPRKSGDFRTIQIPKTVYNPEYLSDRTILRLGNEAINENGVQVGVTGNRMEMIGLASNGLWFAGYFENGELNNFFPIVQPDTKYLDYLNQSGVSTINVPIVLNGVKTQVSVSVNGILSEDVFNYGKALIEKVSKEVSANNGISSVSFDTLTYNQLTGEFEGNIINRNSGSAPPNAPYMASESVDELVKNTEQNIEYIKAKVQNYESCSIEEIEDIVKFIVNMKKQELGIDFKVDIIFDDGAKVLGERTEDGYLQVEIGLGSLTDIKSDKELGLETDSIEERKQFIELILSTFHELKHVKQNDNMIDHVVSNEETLKMTRDEIINESFEGFRNANYEQSMVEIDAMKSSLEETVSFFNEMGVDISPDEVFAVMKEKELIHLDYDLQNFGDSYESAIRYFNQIYGNVPEIKGLSDIIKNMPEDKKEIFYKECQDLMDSYNSETDIEKKMELLKEMSLRITPELSEKYPLAHANSYLSNEESTISSDTDSTTSNEGNSYTSSPNETYRVISKDEHSDLTITTELVTKYGEDVIEEFIDIYDNEYKLSRIIINNDMNLINKFKGIINDLGVDIDTNETLYYINKRLKPLDGRAVLNLQDVIFKYKDPVMFSHELYAEYNEQISELVKIVQGRYSVETFLRNPNIELLKTLKEGLFADSRFDSKITKEIECIAKIADSLIDGKVLVNASNYVAMNEDAVLVDKSLYEEYKNEFNILEGNTFEFVSILSNPNIEQLKRIKKLFSDSRMDLNLNDNAKKLSFVIDSLLENNVIKNPFDYLVNGMEPVLVNKVVDSFNNITYSEYTLAEFLRNPDIDILKEIKKLLDNGTLDVSNNIHAKKLESVINELVNGNSLINVSNYVYSNGKPIIMPKELVQKYDANNPNPGISIHDLYTVMDLTDNVYKLISKEKLVLSLDAYEYIESLKVFVKYANELGYTDNKFVKYANTIVELFNDTSLTINELYDRLSDAHVTYKLPEGYHEFVDLYNKTKRLNSVIKTFENNGYTSEEISKILLSYSSQCENINVSKAFYYRTYNYLVKNKMTSEDAATFVYNQAEKILDTRGTRVIATTSSGVNIRVVNSSKNTNKLLTEENITNLMKKAEKYYSKTGLKDIIIYDTFSPQNIYYEKVQYKSNALKSLTFRFISAASASADTIYLWSDFDSLDSIIHEYAHTIDRYLATKYNDYFTENKEWDDAVSKDMKVSLFRVSEYANANNKEDFAEFLMHFDKNPVLIGLKYPNRYMLLSKYLNMRVDSDVITKYVDTHSPIGIFTKISRVLRQEQNINVTKLISDFIKGEPINTNGNILIEDLLNELSNKYPNRKDILKDISIESVLDEIKISIGNTTNDWYISFKNYLNDKILKNNLNDTNKTDNDVNASIVDIFRKPTYDLETIKNTLLEGDISNLSITDLSILVDSVKKGKINLKKYNLSSESVSILLEHLPVSKIFPLSNVKAVNTFIERFGIDTLVEFDRLNNGFLLGDKGENLYSLYDYFDLSIPSIIAKDKLEELESLITMVITSNKTNERRIYTFNYEKLVGTDYASKHEELFLDVTAPDDLKKAYYSGLVNRGNEYNEEWSKYLEGKSVMGVIHEPLLRINESTILQNINAFSESASYKYEKELQDLAKRLNLSMEEVQSILSKKMNDLINTSSFGVRRTMNSLYKILESGKLKNQFEVNHSSYGINDTKMRMEMEKDMFDIPNNLRNEDRPIYGMLLPEDKTHKYITKGPGSYYSEGNGVIYIFDKSKILDKATITLGDSITHGGNIATTSAQNPKFFGVLGNMLSDIKTKEDLEKFDFRNLYEKSTLEVGPAGYYEFQLHGESSHTLDNIEEILFLKTPDDKIIDKLKELNISWRVL